MIDDKGAILRGGGAHFIGGGLISEVGGWAPLTLSPAYNQTEKETSHNAVAVMYKC